MANTERDAGERKILLVHRGVILNDRKEVLLVQRSKDDSYLPGFWEFPGGKIENGEDAVMCLRNEVQEETGLEIEIVKPVSYVDSYVLGDDSKYAGASYIVLMSICRITRVSDVTLSAEHDDYRWVGFNDIELYELKPEERKSLSHLKNLL